MPRFRVFPLRRLGAALALTALLLAPVASTAASSSTSASGHIGGYTDLEGVKAPPVFDLLIMRPLGLVGLGVSALLWVPAQAVTMATRPSEWEKPIDLMLKKPARFVFADPIGSH
jgi:hypothetical protein